MQLNNKLFYALEDKAALTEIRLSTYVATKSLKQHHTKQNTVCKYLKIIHYHQRMKNQICWSLLAKQN